MINNIINNIIMINNIRMYLILFYMYNYSFKYIILYLNM